ncbi:S41 family peptidase [Massilia niastensis]|uniref:S41 family peptidase n=1 Tax=Massilia niastensis TaxID=544911 RepID=UPI00037E9A5E|nr:S41 family peptidase [Massilia niastensis]
MARRIILAAALAALSTAAFAQEAVDPAAERRRAFDAKLFDSPALATPYRDNLSEDEKVAGLSKFWSEVKYNFVYVDKLKELDWDRLYLEYLPKVRATASTAEYYRVLAELCAKLQDGHTNVYPGAEVRDLLMARPLFTTHLVEGKVLVREVFDAALRARGVAPGVEVVAVDGEPVQAYANRELLPYLSASTPQDMERRAYGYSFLTGALTHTPRVSFRSAAGKAFEADTPRVSWDAFVKAAIMKEPFELRMLPGNVAYVALNSFGDDRSADAFLAAFDRIARASALVIDVRNNGGGNSSVGYRVLATLADKPFDTSKWATRQYLPAYRAWQRPMPDLEKKMDAWPVDDKRHFSGPVAVLTSGATYSAAEDFAVAFDTMKRGILVGEATGGSTGQPLLVQLPGGGRARICTKADTYADGTVWVGKGIQPTVRSAQTLADLRRGRDTVLEAALARLGR